MWYLPSLRSLFLNIHHQAWYTLISTPPSSKTNTYDKRIVKKILHWPYIFLGTPSECFFLNLLNLKVAFLLIFFYKNDQWNQIKSPFCYRDESLFDFRKLHVSIKFFFYKSTFEIDSYLSSLSSWSCLKNDNNFFCLHTPNYSSYISFKLLKLFIK